MKKGLFLGTAALLLILAACRFSGTDPGKTIWWEEDGEGYIQFYTSEQDYMGYWFAFWDDPYHDPMGTVSIQVKKISGHPWGVHGLMFCLQDISNFYQLRIDIDGYYAVFKRHSDAWSTRIDRTYSEHLNQGYDEGNNLRVIRNDATNVFTLEFNGTAVDSFTDSTFQSGYAGYFVVVRNDEDFPADPVDVRFRSSTITVTPRSGLETHEAGGTDSFDVVLGLQPAAEVTVDLASSDDTEGSVSPSSLTFSPDNWSTEQIVTVTGQDDGEYDGNQEFTIITAAAVSSDPSYDGLDPADVSVFNRDNEVYKLLASDAEYAERLGYSVAIDGDYVVAGAYRENDSGTNAGAAYIFHRTDINIWDSEKKIYATDADANDNFGTSVDISGDYLIIGSPYEDEEGEDAGAAYIYRRTGTNSWLSAVKIVAPDAEAGDRFGSAVSISGDFAIVGAPFESEGGSNAGAVYIFQRTGTNAWEDCTKIRLANGDFGPRFGFSVSIDGNYAIVGAHHWGSEFVKPGAAYIYRLTDAATNTWDSGTQILGTTSLSSPEFGYSVGISGDYAIVGEKRYSYAYIFHRTGTNAWGEFVKFTSPDAGGGSFGYSVAICGDDAVVGAQETDESGGEDAGAAYLFHRADTNAWDSGTKILPLDSSRYDYFGCAVSLSQDYAVVGAFGEQEGANYAGAAYVFP